MNESRRHLETAIGSPLARPVRDARRDDVPAIVALYADDDLGRARETVAGPLPATYWTAFEALDSDPRHRLVVVGAPGSVVATLQLSFIPHLARQGAERAQIEAVRVAASHRGQGIGRDLLAWAVDEARRRGCGLVQLTTDATRSDVHRLYESLGFVASHLGMKLHLD